ncbi:MAG: hypothetical protein RLZZ312_1077 [Bacteroidota bacterium]|jgi:enamine deaminase RidA (YjgF/YER057c/UK114 family)
MGVYGKYKKKMVFWIKEQLKRFKNRYNLLVILKYNHIARLRGTVFKSGFIGISFSHKDEIHYKLGCD